MNTKKLLLVLVLITISAASHTASNKQIHQLLNIEFQLPVTDHTSTSLNVDLFVPPLTEKVPHPDEDGKHHHFHFERVSKLRRGRKITCLLCKLVIVVMHASLLVLLSGYIH